MTFVPGKSNWWSLSSRFFPLTTPSASARLETGLRCTQVRFIFTQVRFKIATGIFFRIRVILQVSFSTLLLYTWCYIHTPNFAVHSWKTWDHTHTHTHNPFAHLSRWRTWAMLAFLPQSSIGSTPFTHPEGCVFSISASKSMQKHPGFTWPSICVAFRSLFAI